MRDGSELPTMSEFVKSLAVVLLSEAVVCLAMSAACRMRAAGHGANASGIMLAFYLVVGFAIVSNIATVGIAARHMGDDGLRKYAQTSFYATSGQTVIVAALCFLTEPRMTAVAAIVSFLALGAVLAFTPGKFPPDSMLR